MLYVPYPPMPVRIFRFPVAIFRLFANFIQSVVESIKLFVNDFFESKVCQFCNVNDIIIQLLFRNEIIFGFTMRIYCLKMDKSELLIISVGQSGWSVGTQMYGQSSLTEIKMVDLWKWTILKWDFWNETEMVQKCKVLLRVKTGRLLLKVEGS